MSITNLDAALAAKIMRLGQIADYSASWPRVRVERHPHWCGAVEQTPRGLAARTTCSCEDDDHACAALLPSDLNEAEIDGLLAVAEEIRKMW